MTINDIRLLSEEGAKEYLTILMEALDNIDDCSSPGDDPFCGSWRDYVLGEDSK